MKKVSIIIVNYKNYEDTIECLKSLKNLNYDNYDIILIDNSTNKEDLDNLSKTFTDIFIYKFKENIGFAKACNIGIKHAINNKSDYILLLNNDTIVEPDFLDLMVDTFNFDNNIGIVGCRIMNYYNKSVIWYDGGKFDKIKFIPVQFNEKKYYDEIYNNDTNRKREIEFVTFVTGCSMLIKKEVFEKIGLLDENLFMYYEDVEFCLKSIESGFKLAYNPNAIIYHKISKASGGENSLFGIQLFTRNRVILMKKYKYKFSLTMYIFINIYFYFSRIIRIIQYMLKFDYDRANAIFRGMFEGIQYNKIES